MNIENLKEKYLNLTKTCAETDYTDKKSVRKNNSSVNEMYKIIELISKNDNSFEILKFAELLTVNENRTNLWVATHMLERLNVDKKTEQKALKIIKRVANENGTEAIGYKNWLTDYKLKIRT
ncbi:hypothetical protein FNB79_09815 [Formosa sediminum]|uniref:HEAT repeat domain-containing protein n=1 Tax=Formosa sediminum TaxID=2594004 RepID=A0A516GRW2_9FLAO|nr:hypothetical protein [Formosa sediminum]QDO94254.1 hypothetical protein FNB79_09815 [Formosa sediminum]